MPSDKAKLKDYLIYDSTYMTLQKSKIKGQKIHEWLSGNGCGVNGLIAKGPFWGDGNIPYLDCNGVYTIA